MADPIAIITAFASGGGEFTEPGTVTIIDVNTTNPVSGSPFTVGVCPNAVAFSPDEHWAAITNGGVADPPSTGSIQLIDVTTNPPTIGSAIDLGLSTSGVEFSPDSQTVYALNGYSGTIDVLDLIDGTWTIRTGAGYPVASSQSDTTDALWQNMAIYIDVDGGWWGFAPNSLVDDGVDPIGTTVDVFNLSASPPVLVYTLTVGNLPTAVALADDVILVTNGADATVGVIDCTPLPGATPAYSDDTIAVGNGPYWAQTNFPTENLGYISNVLDNTISVITIPEHAVTDLITGVSAPVAGAFSPDGSTYFCCSAGNYTISIINVSLGTVTGSFSTPGLPTGIGITPGQIITTGQGAILSFFGHS